MSLFPFATTEDLTLTDQEVTASSIREYEIDFEKGTLTGRIVTGVDALCVWAYLALKAKRYRWIIYSWGYGDEVYDLIGHTVTVVSAVGKTVSIKSRITLNDGYQWSQVKPKAEETLEAYFLEMRKNWEKGNLVVRISQIENRLLNLDGILDVADTQLNDVASNLALAQEEIPLLGGVYIG